MIKSVVKTTKRLKRKKYIHYILSRMWTKVNTLTKFCIAKTGKSSTETCAFFGYSQSDLQALKKTHAKKFI